MRNPVVVLTDVAWVSFVSRYWLAMLLNSPVVIVPALIWFRAVACNCGELSELGARLGATFLGFIASAVICIPIFDGLMLGESGYWERRGI